MERQVNDGGGGDGAPPLITCCFPCLLAHLVKQYTLRKTSTDHFAGHLGDGAAGSIMRISHFANKGDGTLSLKIPATSSSLF